MTTHPPLRRAADESHAQNAALRIGLELLQGNGAVPMSAVIGR